MDEGKPDSLALTDVQQLLDACRDINRQVEQLATHHGIKVGTGLNPDVIRNLEELVANMTGQR